MYVFIQNACRQVIRNVWLNLLLLYSQELHYYPLTIKLDRCVGSCNTLDDSSNKVCVPNKMEDVNLCLTRLRE